MSLRKAIDEKCKDCIYDPKSGLGQWRQQVQACTAVDCPLWTVRPKSYQTDKIKELQQEGKRMMEETW